MNTSDLFDLFLSLARKRVPLELDRVSRASAVTDLGLDSLALMELISELEEKMDVTIPDEDLMRLHTVGDLVDRVVQLKSRRVGRPA